MRIRTYHSEDCEKLAELFYNTVHTINAKDYTEEQLTAWADGNVDPVRWNQSFMDHYCVVAVEGREIVGFGDIDKAGYLDRLYVHRDFQNQGIATAICHELEQALDVERITVHASITAKPFFIRRGYNVLKKQQLTRKGIVLTNYIMEKKLDQFSECM